MNIICLLLSRTRAGSGANIYENDDRGIGMSGHE